MHIDNSVHKNVFLVGPMGVGKTMIGKLLAQELSLTFVDSDQEIESRAGADISWIFDKEGEAGFRVRESKMIEELTRKEGILLATGGGVILCEVNRQHLRDRGVVVFLDMSLEVQMERIRNDRKRPLLQGVDTGTVLEEMKTLRDPLYRSVSHIRMFVDGLGSRKVVSDIIDAMSELGFLKSN